MASLNVKLNDLPIETFIPDFIDRDHLLKKADAVKKFSGTPSRLNKIKKRFFLLMF